MLITSVSVYAFGGAEFWARSCSAAKPARTTPLANHTANCRFGILVSFSGQMSPTDKFGRAVYQTARTFYFNGRVPYNCTLFPVQAEFAGDIKEKRVPRARSPRTRRNHGVYPQAVSSRGDCGNRTAAET